MCMRYTVAQKYNRNKIVRKITITKMYLVVDLLPSVVYSIPVGFYFQHK